jgi:hypothetical protein
MSDLRIRDLHVRGRERALHEDVIDQSVEHGACAGLAAAALAELGAEGGERDGGAVDARGVAGRLRAVESESGGVDRECRVRAAGARRGQTCAGAAADLGRVVTELVNEVCARTDHGDGADDQHDDERAHAWSYDEPAGWTTRKL